MVTTCGRQRKILTFIIASPNSTSWRCFRQRSASARCCLATVSSLSSYKGSPQQGCALPCSVVRCTVVLTQPLSIGMAPPPPAAAAAAPLAAPAACWPLQPQRRLNRSSLMTCRWPSSMAAQQHSRRVAVVLPWQLDGRAVGAAGSSLGQPCHLHGPHPPTCVDRPLICSAATRAVSRTTASNLPSSAGR